MIIHFFSLFLYYGRANKRENLVATPLRVNNARLGYQAMEINILVWVVLFFFQVFAFVSSW